MSWTLIAITGIGLLILITIIAAIWAAMMVAKRSDNDIGPDALPRCDATGQPLTPRQQYDRECG